MLEKALFAGGCFWCMVEPFDEKPGIEKVISGYTDGHIKNPTYEQVKSQKSGHTEAVQIIFDPSLITFKELVDIYWTVTDPTDAGGQFMDRGDSYRPVIFYYDEGQKITAESSKQKLEESNYYKDPILTKIKKASIFYEAEEKHQDFYKKNKERYHQEKKERKHWVEGTHTKQKGMVN